MYCTNKIDFGALELNSKHDLNSTPYVYLDMDISKSETE